MTAFYAVLCIVFLILGVALALVAGWLWSKWFRK